VGMNRPASDFHLPEGKGVKSLSLNKFECDDLRYLLDPKKRKRKWGQAYQLSESRKGAMPVYY